MYVAFVEPASQSLKSCVCCDRDYCLLSRQVLDALHHDPQSADIRAESPSNVSGYFPLHLLAQRGADMWSRQGGTTEAQYMHLVDCLLRAASDHNPLSSRNRTPLLTAATSVNEHMLDALARLRSVDLHALDQVQQRSVVDQLLWQRRPDLAQTFSNLGAPTVNPPPRSTRAPSGP